MSRLPFQKKTVLATSRPIIPLHTLANTPNHPFCILFLPTSKSPSHTPFFGHLIAPPAHLPIPLLQLLFDLTTENRACRRVVLNLPRLRSAPAGRWAELWEEVECFRKTRRARRTTKKHEGRGGALSPQRTERVDPEGQTFHGYQRALRQSARVFVENISGAPPIEGNHSSSFNASAAWICPCIAAFCNQNLAIASDCFTPWPL